MCGVPEEYTGLADYGRIQMNKVRRAAVTAAAFVLMLFRGCTAAGTQQALPVDAGNIDYFQKPQQVSGDVASAFFRLEFELGFC